MSTTTDSATGAGRRIALTGAAGSLAQDIIPTLVGAGYDVVAIDQVEPSDGTGLTWRLCSINDRERLSAAMADCSAVIHLAGIPLEDDWERILHANIDGTQAVLETAVQAGMTTAVLASSIHATGFVPVPAGAAVPDDVRTRPNTFYGVSKATLEALGSYYHDRYGIDVTCLRIASRFPEPRNVRMLSTWLSPADAGQLFIAALENHEPGFRTVWGVSANSRSYLSHEGGVSIGFTPQDDAESFSASIEAAAIHDSTVGASEWDRNYIGGIFSSPDPPRKKSATDQGLQNHRSKDEEK